MWQTLTYRSTGTKIRAIIRPCKSQIQADAAVLFWAPIFSLYSETYWQTGTIKTMLNYLLAAHVQTSLTGWVKENLGRCDIACFSLWWFLENDSGWTSEIVTPRGRKRRSNDIDKCVVFKFTSEWRLDFVLLNIHEISWSSKCVTIRCNNTKQQILKKVLKDWK